DHCRAHAATPILREHIQKVDETDLVRVPHGADPHEADDFILSDRNAQPLTPGWPVPQQVLAPARCLFLCREPVEERIRHQSAIRGSPTSNFHSCERCGVVWRRSTHKDLHQAPYCSVCAPIPSDHTSATSFDGCPPNW